jgi:hypothetical protein
MGTVGIITSSKLNQPIWVIDYSSPVVETVIEEVELVRDGMTIISERFNPFFKTTFYKVERTMITGYKKVGSFFDYRIAVQVAKKYAKENGLKYEH